MLVVLGPNLKNLLSNLEGHGLTKTIPKRCANEKKHALTNDESKVREFPETFGGAQNRRTDF